MFLRGCSCGSAQEVQLASELLVGGIYAEASSLEEAYPAPFLGIGASEATASTIVLIPVLLVLLPAIWRLETLVLRLLCQGRLLSKNNIAYTC